MDNPFKTWQQAVALSCEGKKETSENIKVQIVALESIRRDLDEHGDENLHEYGGGKYSTKDFSRFLEEAKTALRHLNSEEGKVRTPSFHSVSAVKVEGSRKIPGGNGPRPLILEKSFLSADGDFICLRDMESGKVLKTFSFLLSDMRSVTMHSDLHLLAIGSWNGKISLFDTETTQSLLEMNNHSDWVRSLSFSKDGKILLSGSDDKIIIHEIPSGTVTASLGSGDTFDGMGPIDKVAIKDDSSSFCHCQKDVTAQENMVMRGIPDLKEQGRIDTYVSEFEFIADNLVALPYNKISLIDPHSGDTTSSSMLLERETRWASGQYLALNEDKAIAALLLKEEPEDGKTYYELQVWSLHPLKPLEKIPVNDFEPNTEFYKGGIAMTRDYILLAGKNETLQFRYTVKAE